MHLQTLATTMGFFTLESVWWFLSIGGIVGIALTCAWALTLAVILYQAKPLTKRASFLKPAMTEQQKRECLKDLDKIGNRCGLDNLWKTMAAPTGTGTGTTVLLTGVTGYVGRSVLLQLFQCIAANSHPDKTNTKIILMVRPEKRGAGTAQDRVDKLRQEDIFSDIPRSLWDSVVSVVETNGLAETNLGYSKEGLQKLKEANITHVVHSAADTAFNKDLACLAESNITSALQLQAFARDCPSCQRMTFISTAFVNPGKGTPQDPLPEALVPLHGYDPIELYQSMRGNQILARQVRDLLGFYNNYTFSKCVVEHLLSRQDSSSSSSSDLLQTSIVRPGIVGPAFALPRPGWNGAMPSTVTAYSVMWMSRLIRVSRSNMEPFPQIPVDVVAVGVVNSMLQDPTNHSEVNIQNLVWDAQSNKKFVSSETLIRTGMTWCTFNGHFSFLEIALMLTLNDLAKARPAWAPALHEIFNKGPLRILKLIQDTFRWIGIKVAPGFPAAKMLKFVDIGSLYDPFVAGSFYFRSTMQIPESFDVDRYVAEQLQTTSNFLRELKARGKKGSKKDNPSGLKSAPVQSNELQLAPPGRWDLWWALTQPSGSLAVRVVCYLASKVFRAVYGDSSLDLETAAALLDGLPKTDRKTKIVLLPTFSSPADIILVLYIAFAFPLLGVPIPTIFAERPFRGVILAVVAQCCNIYSVGEAPRKHLQDKAVDASLAIFLGETQSLEEQAGLETTAVHVLRALQLSREDSEHVLIPMCIHHDRVLDETSQQEMKWHHVLKYFFTALAGTERTDLGSVKVSFGKAVVMDRASDVPAICASIQKEQRLVSQVTDFVPDEEENSLCLTEESSTSNFSELNNGSGTIEQSHQFDTNDPITTETATRKTAPAKAEEKFPLLPLRWYVVPLLAFLAYMLSPYAIYVSAFYVVTWTASPIADWHIVKLAQRSLSGRYGNLPLRFNLTGIAILSWLVFVRYPLETVLWYLDEILFPGYSRTTIEEPLLILGQPRSGTTKFQDVLSADQDTFCSMYLYEMRYPFLTVQYLVDIMFKMDQKCLGGQGYKLALGLGLLYVLPETGERKMMRRLRYDLPDEDDNLFLFHGPAHFALTGVFPSEVRSLCQFRDLPKTTRIRMMRFHQKAVQKVMYRRGRGRHYLCKWVAGWNGLLDEAKVVYPDAKHAVIVRDPREQLPSWMKLQGLLSEQLAGHNVMKMPEVRSAVIDINVQWHQTQAEFCAASAGKNNLQIIQFDDFVENIPREVSKVYDLLGLSVQPGSAFHDSLGEAHRNQSKHKKTVIRKEEEFITEEEILSRFPPLRT
ncbi:Glycerone-phosphate O-acyltransferase [Seminavis robusta]|uniref:Fatty acyl-CoA reductase n=1 Tax=Seminavis robusta TaxID=568900 RepID=A0A9N8HDI0_9STRA|nr:Glycerone-phosphate O-acyltransferase [Seminavis robusta]|eukprot:Sro428_g140940.1 Glycerone-phosphate O-acyltransferase (1308) ;mRNA; f:58076-61999